MLISADTAFSRERRRASEHFAVSGEDEAANKLLVPETGRRIRSVHRQRRLPLTINHPPVNDPMKSLSSDTAKL